MASFVGQLWRELSERIESAERFAAMWRPSMDVPDWLAPGLALSGLLSLALLSGIALASLGIMLTALLMAYLLLENVFGLSFELSVQS